MATTQKGARMNSDTAINAIVYGVLFTGICIATVAFGNYQVGYRMGRADACNEWACPDGGAVKAGECRCFESVEKGR